MPGQGWPAFPDRSYGGITGTKFALGGARTMWDYEASEKAAKHRAVRAERMAEAKKKGTHTKLEWLALQYITGHQCAKCGSEYYVKDHIVPLCLGGCDCIANIQPLCTSCNSSKSLDTTDYRPLYWSECFEEVMSTVPSWVKL